MTFRASQLHHSESLLYIVVGVAKCVGEVVKGALGNKLNLNVFGVKAEQVKVTVHPWVSTERDGNTKPVFASGDAIVVTAHEDVVVGCDHSRSVGVDEGLNNEHAVLAEESVFISEFVRSVSEQFQDYPGGLQIECPEEDREFLIDRLRMRLLITNLLNNAIRHGKGLPISVALSFFEERAIVEVIDRGEGIAEEHLDQISEPFYRADSARQRNTGGFGLGLYLCRLIAQAHGGELIIRSKLGEGTHISVNLPPAPPNRK